ncbi:hypothetical protein ACA910_004478 [Epithemia clementina (nom. ined.)]
MGIQIFTMLLIEGLSNALRFAERGEKAAAEEFIELIESIVNTEIFGDAEHEAQWQMPLSDGRKTIGKVYMSNVRTQKVIAYIEALIKFCVFDEDRK